MGIESFIDLMISIHESAASDMAAMNLPFELYAFVAIFGIICFLLGAITVDVFCIIGEKHD